MYSVVSTAILRGIESIEVSVEADVSDGMPVFEMVGLLGSEVKEARERVRTALRNSGCLIPAKRITVNLSPADVRKSGASFDLPIAVAILVALGLAERKRLRDMLVAGEVGLNGDVLPVEGILPMVAEAKQRGKACCMVAEANVQEASLIEGIRIYGMRNLRQVIRFLNSQPREEGVRGEKSCGISLIMSEEADRKSVFSEGRTGEKPGGEEGENASGDFSEINGQQFLKHACEVAVSGMHHLLMSGPPGAGKTMAAKRIAGILPPLTREEQLEISKIYSVSGLLADWETLMIKRPFRNPHHTISPQGLAGGGRYPRPGEITLAHGGVLFLDEMTEFDKATLEVLRQPLEEKQISLARLTGTYRYPADFLLVGAMNPCACGYYPDRSKCRCSDRMIRHYLSKISQPLLDRMDICIDVPRLEYEELTGRRKGNETSSEIRKRVMRVHEIQRKRYEGTDIRYNSRIPSSLIEEYCPLGEKQRRYMHGVYQRLELSARAYHKILKVARTLADMEESEEIRQHHLSEAVCYRSFDKKIWER